MNKKYIVSADIGASSGKMTGFIYDGSRIVSEAQYDFQNIPVNIFSHSYWNVFSIYNDIIKGLSIFSKKNPDSIGIDTFGASFGFLNKQGLLAEPVFHYKDISFKNALNEIYRILDKKEIFMQTGCQPNRTYSLPHLFTFAKMDYAHFDSIEHMMFLPDLLSYFLSGEISTELSIAGTSALLNNSLNDWNYDMLNKLGIPTHFLSRIVNPGTIKGVIDKSIATQTGMEGKTAVVATCSHDTASAVTAIPNFDEHSVYIGSGSNINMGIETEYIGLSDEHYKYGLKNTGGICNKNLIYKDFPAFSFLNSLTAIWKTQNKNYTYDQLYHMSAGVKNNSSYIDLESDIFNKPYIDMSKSINSYLSDTGQKMLDTDAQLLNCIFESIALKVSDTVDKLERISKCSINKIYIVNGGSRNKFLNQLIADSTGKTVYAGMANASQVGNALTQLLALGELKGIDEIRDLSANSFEFYEYLPQETDKWNEKKEYAFEKLNKNMEDQI